MAGHVAAFHSPSSSGDNSHGCGSSTTVSMHIRNRGSPTETDFSTSTATMSTQSDEDIYHVLDDAFGKINRVFEHLRKCGQNEATSRLARDMTTILDNIVSSVEQLDPAQRNITSDVRREASLSDLEFPRLPYAQPTSKSWAAVTATIPTTNSNGVVKHTPSDSVKRRADDQVSVDPDNQRVVWIQPWSSSRLLKDVTDGIKSGLGAIYSIAFSSEDSAVCVIFQHAHSATIFLEDCAHAAELRGSTPFGRDVTVSPGQPYALNAALRRMDLPHGERRRLTFARQQLFGPRTTEAMFRKELEGIVGKSNLETVHLFNAGNATVVLSAVPLAALVKEHFMTLARTRQSPYFGLMVSFSHDPCERPLSLPSQFGPCTDATTASRSRRTYTASTPASGISRTEPGSDRGVSSYRTAASRPVFSDSGARVTIDEVGGWRTVKRR